MFGRRELWELVRAILAMMKNRESVVGVWNVRNVCVRGGTVYCRGNGNGNGWYLKRLGRGERRLL